MRRISTAAALACLAVPALADFSYQEKSQMTGGALLSMMRALGPFAKSAREPMVSRVLVSGDRMAHVSDKSIRVVDLTKETITEINLEKKTYTVITFAQMAEASAKAMEQAQQKMKEAKKEQAGAPQVKMDFSVSVKETGRTRNISGLDTKEFLMLMDMEGTDPQTNQKTTMTMATNAWLAPKVPGYEEVQDFYKRMAMKMAANVPLNAMAAGMGAMMSATFSQGAAKMAEEMSKMDGIQVLQVMRMGAKEQMDPNAPPQSELPPGSQPEGKTVSQAAGDAAARSAADSAAGRLGRVAGLGGLGGFGRRKKAEPPPEQPPAQAPAQPAPGSGVLMEMTTELGGFSSAPVDKTQFGVPAGFKQEEHPMLKMLRK